MPHHQTPIISDKLPVPNVVYTCHICHENFDTAAMFEVHVTWEACGEGK